MSEGKGDSKASTTIHATFGCSHVKDLLQQARTKAVDGYTRVTNSLRKEGNLSDRIYKSDGTPAVTVRHTYLCMQCPFVSEVRERHAKGHGFYVDSETEFVYCLECKDYIYDPTFEDVRTSNPRKRKYSATLSESDQRLVSANATATPCSATGLRGFYNMGQTCFMSVILQSLIHNPLLRTFYLSEGHRASDCEREACTSCALDFIFTDFFGDDKHEGFGAVHMLQGCWKGGGGLAGYSQQDAHEFLGFILNSLHEANTEDEDKSRSLKAGRDCPCIVHQTFGGLYRSAVTCLTCKNTNNTLDPFMDLSLDIRNTNVSIKKKKLAMIDKTQTIKEVLPMDLSECLDRFTTAETLSSDSYNCRNCGTSREAKKKLSLSRLPAVIPIHLKRFSHSKKKGESSKVDTRVRFPFTLDLAPYTTPSKSSPEQQRRPDKDDDDEDEDEDGDTIDVKTPTKASTNKVASPSKAEYLLFSVIVHKGTMENGHYISYARQDNDWFRFDDSMVVQVDEREVLSAEAYMLFYIVAEI